MGVVSPLGLSLNDTWTKLKEKQSGITSFQSKKLIDLNFKSKVSLQNIVLRYLIIYISGGFVCYSLGFEHLMYQVAGSVNSVEFKQKLDDQKVNQLKNYCI